jgi:hypothetical protein
MFARAQGQGLFSVSLVNPVNDINFARGDNFALVTLPTLLSGTVVILIILDAYENQTRACTEVALKENCISKISTVCRDIEYANSRVKSPQSVHFNSVRATFLSNYCELDHDI